MYINVCVGRKIFLQGKIGAVNSQRESFLETLITCFNFTDFLKNPFFILLHPFSVFIEIIFSERPILYFIKLKRAPRKHVKKELKVDF